MTLLIQDNRSLKIDSSNLGLHEKHLVEKLWPLLEKQGYDLYPVSTGVNPCPDFGYFELASRYWRASLCIYFAGISKAFIEAGAGFLEPWLYNSRHAIELHIKGLLLYVVWYQELHDNPLKSGYKKKVKEIQNDHNAFALYREYKDKLKVVLSGWTSDKLCEQPELDKLTLTERCEDILSELFEADPKSFRFRYPSLKKKSCQKILEMSWEWNEDKLFPVTGLPKEAGVAFMHVKVINSLHELVKTLSDIGDYHDTFYAYLEELQGFAYEW